MSMRTANLRVLSHQRGLTLVELMVSLVLSLVLMLGAMQLFSGSKQTYQLSDSLARVQENGRFALDLLSRDIRQAGFTGCIAAPDFSNLLNLTTPPAADEWPYNFQRPLFGFDGDNATFPTGAASGSPGAVWTATNADGEVADSVVALFADSTEVFEVIDDPADAAAAVSIAPVAGLTAGQIMLITDCSRSALFEATSVSTTALNTSIGHATGTGNPGNCENTLHNSCGSGVEISLLKPYNSEVSRVSLMQASGYYIGDTTRLNVAGNAIPALYRQSLTANTAAADRLRRDELVEGVSDLQITYGIAPANSRSADRFVRADEMAAADWARVVAVRIDLTVQSVTEPGLSKDFSTTVAVRNRTL